MQNWLNFMIFLSFSLKSDINYKFETLLKYIQCSDQQWSVDLNQHTLVLRRLAETEQAERVPLSQVAYCLLGPDTQPTGWVSNRKGYW